MRFRTFYFKETIDWEQYVKNNDELRGALEVMKKIQDAGYEALLVGGFVRDLLMGKPSDDIDLTTNATPEEIDKIFDKTIDIGKNKAMGVSVVPHRGYNYEIATYRTDAYEDMTKGTGADKVELVKSFKDDSARRDFTINSLGIDADGNVVDHHGGLKDIENKVITAVGDPHLRFKEDEIRRMRGVRFASKLGFDIDPKTYEAIKSNAPNIKKVAQERIFKELVKMASAGGKDFARAVEMMKDTGLLKEILPEIEQMDTLSHSPEDHPEGNVISHTLAALKSTDSKDPKVLLSILFHDIGKLESHSEEGGKHHYYGHPAKSRRQIEKIAERLKMPNDIRDAIIFSAEEHMKAHDILKMNKSSIAKLMQDPDFDVLMKVAEADAKARGEKFDKEEWDQILDKVGNIKSSYEGEQAIKAVEKVVNGKLIMDLRGLTPKDGPEIGRIKRTVVQQIIDNDIPLDDKKTITDYIMSA